MVSIRRSAYFPGVIRLRRADLEAILGFLVDVGELEFDLPYPVGFVARLEDLIRCDAITYQEFDPVARRSHAAVYIGPEANVDDEVYWTVGPCPITEYRDRTGDLGSVRMSDVIARRRYHELPVYRDYFRSFGLDHILDVGLSVDPRRHRTFTLFRRPSASDFSERERDVLEMLRPHLYHLEAQASLRRALSKALGQRDGDRGHLFADLTPREREIVELVGEGKTNAEIAATLWVAPSTVKKHLEHVYAKTGIARRAGVATARYASSA
jgi:DNA-binding CsgD family transcriptional regulator